jgi:hypothetical protein
MLRKLLKYEFKSTARKFLPLYGAIVAVSIVLNLGVRFPHLMPMNMLGGFILFGLFVALAILTLSTVVKRFKDNLLSDEGYLMFTLPVSSEKLILSKLLTAIVWIISSGFFAFISALLIMANKEFINAMSEFSIHLHELMAYLTVDYVVIAILFLITVLFQTVYFVLLIYTSLSVSQIAVFNKHRTAVSIITFIVLLSVVNTILGNGFSDIFRSTDFADTKNITNLLIVCIVTNLTLCGIMFAGTNYLLKNHLNIE